MYCPLLNVTLLTKPNSTTPTAKINDTESKGMISMEEINPKPTNSAIYTKKYPVAMANNVETNRKNGTIDAVMKLE